MAQWNKIQELSAENTSVLHRVSEILKRTGLTTEVRHELSDWIESKQWSDLKSTKYANDAFAEVIALLKEKEDAIGLSFVDRLKWGQERQKLQESCATPEVFVESMENCLQQEILLIQSCESQDDDGRRRRSKKSMESAKRNYDLDLKIQKINQDLETYEKEVHNLEAKQEELFLELPLITAKLNNLTKQISLSTSGRQSENLQNEKNGVEQDLKNRVLQHYDYRKEIGSKHVILATAVCYLLKEIWQEIGKWQKDQKLEITALSKPKEGHIDLLEEICENGANLLQSVIRQISRVLDIYEKRPYNNDTMVGVMQQTLNELKTDYLTEHLNKVSVVEKNVSNQILKVTTGRSAQFSMSLRVLGGKALGLQHNPPKVTARLYYEPKLAEMLRDGVQMEDSVCKIANSEGKLMEFKRGQCIASFNSMQLSNLRRNERGNKEELVTEQKYGVIFFMEVQVLGSSYTVKSLSLPIILTSQTSQECMAKGTLIWDAAFSEDVTTIIFSPKKHVIELVHKQIELTWPSLEKVERTPYTCKDQVKWPEVATFLNAQFVEATGRPLKKEQLKYLARIVFRTKKAIDYESKKITDKELIRDKLLPRDFSFWKWFWACLNLVKDTVKTEWVEDKIFGFISKTECEEFLKDAPNGTFLLRFSEQSIEHCQKASICGYLTVAVIETNPDTGSRKVFYVKQHLTPKEISEKGLLTILESFEVADYQNPGKKKPLLVYLYPDTSHHFSCHFKTYGGRKNTEDPGYESGKFKVEIFLTRHNPDQSNLGNPLSPSQSIDMVPPSPASFVSVTNGSPPDASPASSDIMGYENDTLWEVPNRQVPMAQVQPMYHDRAVKRACVGPTNGSDALISPTSTPWSPQSPMFQPDGPILTADMHVSHNVVIESVPQVSEPGILDEAHQSLNALHINEPITDDDDHVITEFLRQNGDAWISPVIN